MDSIINGAYLPPKKLAKFKKGPNLFMTIREKGREE
jgi:hypothetical protein